MKRVFGTYRPERISNPYSLGNGISLNGGYEPSAFLSNQFSDYEAAGLTKIIDGSRAMPEERYTAEIAPGIPKLTRFIIGEYNEEFVDGAEFAKSVQAVGARFQIEMFATAQDAVSWLKANTDLVEEEPGKFLLYPETEYMGEIVPAKYLVIG